MSAATQSMETEGDKIEVLKSIFPQLGDDVVIDALASNEWNMEISVQCLLIISESKSEQETVVNTQCETRIMSLTPPPILEQPITKKEPITAPSPKAREKKPRWRDSKNVDVTQGVSYKIADQCIAEHDKVLILMRGVPGSGKSTLARAIAERHDGVVFSSDDFHYDQTGVYRFDPANLSEAHSQNARRAQFTMESGVSPVIIDNTNIELWETRPYAMSACKEGYDILVLEPDTPWRYDPRICGQRNTHGVSRNKTTQMIEKLRRNTITSSQVKAYGISCLEKARGEDVEKAEEKKTLKAEDHKELAKQDESSETCPETQLQETEKPVPVESPIEIPKEEKIAAIDTTPEEPAIPIEVQESFDLSCCKGLEKNGERERSDTVELGPEIQLQETEQQVPAETPKEEKIAAIDVTSKEPALPIEALESFDLFYYKGLEKKEGRKRSDTVESVVSANTDSGEVPLEASLKPLQKPRRKCKIMANFSIASTELTRVSAQQPQDTTIVANPTLDIKEEEKTLVKEPLLNSENPITDSLATSLSPCVSAPARLQDIEQHGDNDLKAHASSTSVDSILYGSIPDDWSVLSFKPEVVNLPESDFVENQKTYDDVSIQTNFGDGTHLREILAIPRNINIGKTLLPPIQSRLKLDKGTLTDAGEFESNTSVKLLIKLFPTVEVDSLKDVLQNCGGDVDWTVNVLLDSGYEITPEVPEMEECHQEDVEEISVTVEKPIENQDIIPPEIKEEKRDSATPKHSKKRERKELKAEEFFVMAPSLSEQTRRITGKDYSSFTAYKIRCRKGLEVPQPVDETPMPQEAPLLDENIFPSEAPCVLEKEEEEMVPLVIPKDFAKQLVSMFASTVCSSNQDFLDSTPDDMKIQIPKALAFEFFSYWYSSVFCSQQAETRKGSDDEGVSKEETQGLHKDVHLQEIMDMELALQIAEDEKNNSDEMINKRNTMAFKLSQKQLHESFPHVDSSFLDALFEANQYNYDKTIRAIEDLIGTAPKNTSEVIQKTNEHQHIKTEDVAVPITDWKTARACAQEYNNQRKHYLSKANEAFRKGMPAVASYYAQQALYHGDASKDYNEVAMELLSENSKKEDSSSYTVDLHFLHVAEALKVLDGHLKRVLERGDERAKGGFLHVITGRGLKSINGISRIKPAVEAYLKQKKIRFEEANPGMLKVRLQ
ncbi:uncharacterized protein LOC136038925 [Artemia franciscana]|uniref:uncharacterized protein LOC136038925 n=1 Tax=Artemia franciscana TaxID=6661 RepID=UPI0032DBBC19